MASKKSAASAKVIKPEINNNVTEEEAMAALVTEFELMKEAFIMTIETQIKTACRVDNLMNVRDYSQRFWDGNPGMCNIGHYKMLTEVGISTYQKVLDRSKEFTLEEFMKTELQDYYADITPCMHQVDSEEELEIAGIIFLSVQPYGQKMMGMHQAVQKMMGELGIEVPEE